MNVETLAIAGVVRATPRRKAAQHFDWYRSDALAAHLPEDWTPSRGTNQRTLVGVIDGLYFGAGTHVVTCVYGRIAFVVVDLRVGSPTFGRWIPEDLDTKNQVTMVVPPGIGWGFQTITAGASLLSLHNETESNPPINPRDPDLEIAWPLNQAGPPQGMSLSEAIPLLPVAHA